MLISGLFTIFSSQTKVPQAFIDKYNETASIASEIEVAASNFNLQALDQKGQAKDYNGAIKLVDDALAQNSDVAGKIDLLKQRVSELRSLSSKISDPKIKSKALTLINLMEEGSVHSANVFVYQKQLLEMLHSYYSSLAAGGNPTFSADTLISQTDAEGKILTDLSPKITFARDDFFKAAGITINSTPTPSTGNSTSGENSNNPLPPSQQPSQPASGNNEQQQLQTGNAIFGCPELQMVGTQTVKSGVPFVLQNTDSKPHEVRISIDTYSFSAGEKKTITIKGAGNYQPYCDNSKVGQLNVGQ